MSVLVVVGLLCGALLTARLGSGLLGAHHRRAGTPLPRVSVVVPARDEEATIGALLASLRAQELPQGSPAIEVIVVDDGSTDRTAELAAAGGADVVASGAMPAGWLGKPWACEQGARRSSGHVLVFLDADVTLEPTAIADLVDAHRALVPDGMLSVQPFHRTRRAYEQLSTFPNLVSVLASGEFAAWRQRSARVAFGPCIVTGRDAYLDVGGHAAVAGEVIEDVHLAHRYVEADRPVRCLAGGGTISFRMYPAGLRQLVEGWTKNLAGGARLAPVLPTLLTVAWVVALLAAAIDAAPALGDLVRTFDAPDRGAALVLVPWLAATAQVGWILRRIGAFRWWATALYLVPLVGFIVLFARSFTARVLRREVTWRGRTIAVGHP